MTFRPVVARLALFTLVVFNLPSYAKEQRADSALDLVEQFKSSGLFFKQLEVAKKLVTLHDGSVLPELEPYLGDADRHIRANAAFVFEALGDDRGFDTLRAILKDYSDRPPGEITGGRWTLREQIKSDRYYAVHLFGDLGDKRAVLVLIPLLKDPDINYAVADSLGRIGDRVAIQPLIETLGDPKMQTRVVVVDALTRLNAKEALPQLRVLLDDRSKFVADRARAAIDTLSASP